MSELREKSTHKRQKITEEDDFKKSEFYIKNEKDDNAENMWGKDEKFDMEELNLNLLPDDEHSLLRQKREMKWDAKKRKYVQVAIGSDGKATKIKNEAGKFVNYKKDKDPELYKKWMRRTHLKIQDAGEKEDVRTVENARSFHMNRRELKRQGKKTSNIRGRPRDQVKGIDQIEKMKRDNRKMKEIKKGGRRKYGAQATHEFNKRIQQKIETRSRPTRSKIILKKKK